MFDGVGHVHRLAIDTCRLEGLVEHDTCGSDKGLTGDVLFVARLLTDEDHLRRPAALAEHGLRRVLPQIAGSALRRGVAPSTEAFLLRELRITVAGVRRGLGRTVLGHGA